MTRFFCYSFLWALLFCTAPLPAQEQETEEPPKLTPAELCQRLDVIAKSLEAVAPLHAQLDAVVNEDETAYQADFAHYRDCLDGVQSDSCEAALNGTLEVELKATRAKLDKLKTLQAEVEAEIKQFKLMKDNFTTLLGTNVCHEEVETDE